MGTNGAVVQFTPVNVGDMSEIPPDLPAGTWVATCSVKKAKTAKDSFPMLILDWKTTEAMSEENEDHVGQKVSDFLVFFPQAHRGSKMSKIKVKTICEALGIDLPSATKLNSWDDVADFVAELDGAQATIYTTIEERKDSGEMVSKIHYKQPGSSLLSKSSDDDAGEDEDETPKPKKKIAAPPLKKKSR